MEIDVVVARVIGIPAPGTAVWRSVDDPDVTGDLDGVDAVAIGDLVVLEVVRDGFRWLVHDVLEHQRVSVSGVGKTRSRKPHAHPALPPGTVLIAWLPFTNESGDPTDPAPMDVPGKHRPVVALHSARRDRLRVRPLFDASSATARRVDGPRLQHWSVAGLDKASIAGPPTEVPIARCVQTLGELSVTDRRGLGIAVVRRR